MAMVLQNNVIKFANASLLLWSLLVASIAKVVGEQKQMAHLTAES